jgi:hypothetical protein
VTEKLKGLAVDAVNPLTVTTVLCPGVMVVGLNEQVAPEVHAIVMFPVNELEDDVLTVKVVDVDPICKEVDRAFAESE